MQRISTYMPNDDMQYSLRLRQVRMNELQNRMAAQTRIKELRDDALAAARSTKYRSQITRLERFLDNNEKAQGRLGVAEQYLQSANAIVQRVRELAVQGANGTYTVEQKRMMAVEMNELLNELVDVANGRSGDGTTLFAGDAGLDVPFTTMKGNVAGADGQVITSVRYVGGPARNITEISQNAYLNTTFSGGEVFWAEQQEIMTDTNAVSYVVTSDSAILIDGTRIELRAGDNIYAIIAAINDSDAAVKASLDPVNNSLVVRSTYPHQLRIEDVEGSSVLKDLGVISDIGEPPYNYAPGTRVSGGSLFDMIIYVRDRLYNGETVNVGGAGLKGIDLGHRVLLGALADLGAKSERLDIVGSRLSHEIPEVQRRDSEEVDLDLSQAILDLKMLEYSQQAALQTAGRILQRTLLDFLR